MTTPPSGDDSGPQWGAPGGGREPPSGEHYPPPPPQWPPPPAGQYPPADQYPQASSPYYAPPRPTNGLAVASMVLGIIWLYWIGSILALVFGYIAKRQIAERGEGGGGMATAGIVLGWIGVGFLSLFIVLFLVAAVSGNATFDVDGFGQ